MKIFKCDKCGYELAKSEVAIIERLTYSRYKEEMLLCPPCCNLFDKLTDEWLSGRQAIRYIDYPDRIQNPTGSVPLNKYDSDTAFVIGYNEAIDAMKKLNSSPTKGEQK